MLRDMDLGAASRVRRAATWKRIDEGGAWTPLSAHLGSLRARFEGATQTCLNGLAVLFDGPSTAEVAP